MSWMCCCLVVSAGREWPSWSMMSSMSGVDVDTNEPLTIIIPTFTDWLAKKLADQVRHSRVRLSEDGAVRIETVISAVGLFTTEDTVMPEATSVPWVLHLDLRRALDRAVQESRAGDMAAALA